MFLLVYGADGTGKSVQAKSILEASESGEHWSFATKNRKLYKDSGITSIELLRFNKDTSINPYQTMDAFDEAVNKIVKDNIVKTLVIDEITMLRKWAQPCVIEDINKKRRGTPKPMLTKIGENNYAAWEDVNKMVYGKLELLANWSEINDCMVIAITSVVDERRSTIDAETGETKSVTTGRLIVDAKENVRKIADIRIKLEKDGSKGRGYYAIWEKTQDWMQPGQDSHKVDKAGLLAELMVRGVI